MRERMREGEAGTSPMKDPATLSSSRSRGQLVVTEAQWTVLDD